MSEARTQLAALARVVGCELTWGLRECSREVAHWRSLASAIPDEPLRADAFDGLTRKRPHLDGAALFATLPRRRSHDLLRALVAYQTILEYLDDVNERAAGAGVRNGQQLHLALRDALDPGRACADYYRHHPWRHDGGYLRALVLTCQQACAALPGYPAVRAHLLAQARRSHVLALNHEPDPERREHGLRQWAAREHPGTYEQPWYELTGAATGSVTAYGLLTLAAEETIAAGEIERVLAAYPKIALLATMLDSYVDQVRDAEEGSHSYVAYYGDRDAMVARLASLIADCLSTARTLRGGRRNVVIIASMIALYLASDSARSPAMREGTRELARAGGRLTMLLVPVLRAWRIAHGLTGV